MLDGLSEGQTTRSGNVENRHRNSAIRKGKLLAALPTRYSEERPLLASWRRVICSARFSCLSFQNLFLHETTEEWQQYERKIEGVKDWIKQSYQALQSSELKSKPLRDQLRILEQMLADISAQKIKVNMSLEKLQVRLALVAYRAFRDRSRVDCNRSICILGSIRAQVHFHSDIIYTDNPTIVQSGRAIVADLDKLNQDVFQATQNLDQALVQIDGCQVETQAIRQRIVHEEQQLRNILSPLHQTGESEKHEQVSDLIPFFPVSIVCRVFPSSGTKYFSFFFNPIPFPSIIIIPPSLSHTLFLTYRATLTHMTIVLNTKPP